MANATSTHNTQITNILSWIGRPVPVRHTDDEPSTPPPRLQPGEGSFRRLVYAQVDPHDLEEHEVDRLTDADRLALHAGLLRRVAPRRLAHRLEPTDLGREVHRRLQGW